MALEALDLEDVAPAAKLPVPDKGVTTASYTTFDGLMVNVKLFQHDNKSWIAIAATGSGKADAEAKKLDSRVSRWAYAIPGYKAKMMETKTADLLEARQKAREGWRPTPVLPRAHRLRPVSASA